MTLKEKIKKENNTKIISILEDKLNYSQEYVLIVQQEFENRNLSLDVIDAISKNVYKEKIRLIFGNKKIFETNIELPPSSFLSEKTRNIIYRKELEEWKNFKRVTVDGSERYWG